MVKSKFGEITKKKFPGGLSLENALRLNNNSDSIEILKENWV